MSNKEKLEKKSTAEILEEKKLQVDVLGSILKSSEYHWRFKLYYCLEYLIAINANRRDLIMLSEVAISGSERENLLGIGDDQKFSDE
jgi:hypothetical protein